jgi:hypothetical protein
VGRHVFLLMGIRDLARIGRDVVDLTRWEPIYQLENFQLFLFFVTIYNLWVRENSKFSLNVLPKLRQI